MSSDDDARDEGPSEFEIRGRANIAGHLARYITSHGIEVETISGWTSSQWLEAAKGAKISSAVKRDKVPSDKTQGQVIGLVTGHYRRESASV